MTREERIERIMKLLEQLILTEAHPDTPEAGQAENPTTDLLYPI